MIVLCSFFSSSTSPVCFSTTNIAPFSVSLHQITTPYRLDGLLRPGTPLDRQLLPFCQTYSMFAVDGGGGALSKFCLGGGFTIAC